jgi:hypothetical protein
VKSSLPLSGLLPMPHLRAWGTTAAVHKGLTQQAVDTPCRPCVCLQ